MRILVSHCVDPADERRGALEELVTAFLQDGHPVRVVSPRGNRKSATRRLAANLGAYRRLRRACREFVPDVLYERHDPSLVAGAYLARQTAIPLLLEVDAAMAASPFLQALQMQTWRAAHRLLVTSPALRDRVTASGMDCGRICVVADSVPEDQFLASSLGCTRDVTRAVTLGFAGALDGTVQVDRLVARLADTRRTTPMRLLVIGDGPDRSRLQEVANRHGVGDFLALAGSVDPALAPILRAECDIAVQPAPPRPDASLRGLLDWMAAGRAIVAPNDPRTVELLTHERTALLFDPGSEPAMWAAIIRLASDRSLREALGRAARQEIVTRDLTMRGRARRIVAEIA